MYTILSSANSESLSSSFLICILLISSIALARTSRTILNRYGENGQPCLVPDFSGISVGFSPFSSMLAVRLLYIACIMFRYVPCIPALSKTFIMKVCCILLKAFSASNETIVWLFLSVYLYGGLHGQIFIC